MSNYKQVKVNITENQQNKIKESIKAKCAITSIKLRKNDLEGDHVLFLTNAQYKRFEKARNTNKGITINMGLKQLRYNMKEGGFLGALAGIARAALPAIAGVAGKALPAVGKALGVGALGGLASNLVNKILGNGIYLKKPSVLCKIETDGKGLYLTPQPATDFFDQHGYGLYLVDDSGITQVGSGIFDFVRKIPILGQVVDAII